MSKQTDAEARAATGRATAAERMLRSLKRNGVDYVFANLGTDHTPLLEAAARVRDAGEGDAIPEFVVCPHEFAAMSAAHGYAVTTGDPQAVLVHVDVGTQNLGAAMHNAHRANAPVFVIAGLAPVTDDPDQPGSRDNTVHYFQDTFDQPGIVREYCRWVEEYRPPADPDDLVVRGLERAAAEEAGPVYVSATREALEAPIETDDTRDPYRTVRSAGADAGTVADLAARVAAADRPLVITSDIGREPAGENVDALVEFAEVAGAGVVEHTPTTLCFPRDHDLHVGYDPTTVFDDADLILLADTDVPWVPKAGEPPEGVPIIQLDHDPTKGAFPRWSFDVDETVAADPARTLAAVAERLDEADGEEGKEHWRAVATARREEVEEELAAQKSDGRLTAAVLADAIDDVVDEDTVVMEDAVTSWGIIRDHLPLTESGSYHWKGGAGLGWSGGAVVGAKMGNPDDLVVGLVGDGSYLFAHPTVSAWMAAEHGAPNLLIVFDNGGWNAVESATTAEHPEGASVEAGVPESHFGTDLDLSVPATAVDAHTAVVSDAGELDDALAEAVEAVESGTTAVLDVKIER